MNIVRLSCLLCSLLILPAGCSDEAEKQPTEKRSENPAETPEVDQADGPSPPVSDDAGASDSKRQAIFSVEISGLANSTAAEQVREEFAKIATVEKVVVEFERGIAAYKLRMKPAVQQAHINAQLRPIRAVVPKTGKLSRLKYDLHQIGSAALDW